MMGSIGSVLGSVEQIERDRRAVRVFESDAVQQAIRELENIYRADPVASYPGACDTIAQAAAAMAMSAVCSVVNKDPDRPCAYWSMTSPHDWGDLHVPLSGVMIDNPDNIYRTIPVDGSARFEITGMVIGGGPTQETYVLHEAHSGASKGEQVQANEPEAGSVSLHDLKLGPDGRFAITVDNSAAGGRRNHLQTHPDIRDGYILIRSTLMDWSQNNPSELKVRRLSGPPVRPAPTAEAQACQAAERTISIGSYWLAWCRKFFYDRPGNGVTHGFARVSGWGHVSCGRYQLAADEALVVRLDGRGAAYLGFQLSDAWGQGQATAYIERLGSLNGTQACPHGDGTYTYVIALSDPGTYNWLDAIDSPVGTFAIRWQQLPPGVDASDAIKDISLVKLDELKAALPVHTRWCTPLQRAEQLRQRKQSYGRRLSL